MRKFRLLCAAAAIVSPLATTVLLPTAAYAQETTSEIRGDVLAGGRPVAGAQVTVTHVPSGTQSTATTDASGSFNISGLRVGGPFTVSVQAPGFEANEVTGIFLTAGQPFRLPVALNAESAAIVVTAVRGARETSNGPITALGRTDIEGVASVSRDIRDIARRDPFATIDPTNSRTIEIAGQNGRLNRFSVDGVQFSDDFGLNNGGLPTARGPVPFDAIEQFSVRVAPFDISEGSFQGGAINVVLRSGTNHFHGSGFYTHSDDSLTGSETRGVNVDLNFRSTQYGGLLAGPIVPNHLFFMFAYEHLDESQPFDAGVGPGFAQQVPGVTQQQIDQISQIAQTVYNYDTLGLLQNAVEHDDKYIGKLDWNISDDHRLSLTYIRNVGTSQFQQNTFTTPAFAIGLQSNGYELAEEVNSGVLQLNDTWSDVFSTEFRATYRDYNRDQTPFGGRSFSQFGVCLDPTSINAGTNGITSCGGTRVFFGPDISRQTNDLNTETFSADFTGRAHLGAHTIKAMLGYSNVHVFNLFIQNSLGNYYFDSIADFQNRIANQLTLAGAVPSLDPNDAAADFNTRMFTFGLQDDWDVADNLQLTAGVRYDLFSNPQKPPLNTNFVQRYGFSNRATFDGRGALQPRIGFNWQPFHRLVVRGGVGVFAGGTPEVFLSNSFSNTGQLTNSVQITRNTSAAGCTPTPAGTPAQMQAFCNAVLTGVDGRTFSPLLTSFLTTNTASLAAAPVNAIDPDLKIASQLRATLSLNYEANLGPLGDGWLFGADFLYGNVLEAYQWTDIRSVVIGTLPDGRPRYGPLGGVASGNQDLLMTNSTRGRSYIGVLRLSKRFDFGLNIDASYTRSDVTDVNAITSATAGSLYSNNAFLDPNFAAYGRSIYEIRNQWKFRFDYNHAFFGDYRTRFSLFGEYRSGRPYSLTMLDSTSGRTVVLGTIGNGGRALLYVPTANDPRVSFDSAATQAAFDAYVDGHNLTRGAIVSKNSETSPDFFKVDLHLSQQIPTFVGHSRIELFADVENFLNLINSNWSSLRQVAFPQTASLVRVQCLSTPVQTGTAPTAAQVNTSSSNSCVQYRYSSFLAPNEALVTRPSLYQIRVGIRFEF